MAVLRPINDIDRFRSELNTATFVEAASVIWKCRAIKSASEVAALKHATQAIVYAYGEVAATFELDDRPGRVRDALEATQREWIETLTKAILIAMDEGHFHSDIDADQLAYEIYGVFMAFHLYHRLLRDPNARRRATDALDYLLRSAK